MKRIFVTLDTEMDSDKHWIKHYPAEYTSVIEGIPNLLRPIWDRCQVHPIYFISPEILYDNRCIDVLKEEINKGALVGAHLHPEYIDPDGIFGEGMEKREAQFPCYECTDEIEKEKLKNLTYLIEEKLGVKPEWYRAARFGADTATIAILQELGYKYDSSLTPNIDWSIKGGPDHSKAKLQRYHIAYGDIYRKADNEDEDSGIEEVPVTILNKRFGGVGRLLPENWLFYQWLRPTHMTLMELKNILCYMNRHEIEEGVMMFHSMEIMIGKTPYVRNKWMQKYYLWRLEKILQYAGKRGYQL